jgi:nucleotide-binding universal stress UspA family protein
MAGPCIVVGVDGSAAAHEALRWAVELGEALGGRVVAVHGVGLLEEVHDPDEPDSTWRAVLCDLVERVWCARLAGASCPHRVVVRDGPAVDVLLGVAADERADLVVVGCRGIGTANPELTLGSTSLHVLQASRVPVLVVPVREEGVPAAGELALRHLLVGVDRSEPSLAALELAADLAETLGGSMSVLEVFDYVPPFPLGPSAATTSETEEHALERAAALVEAEVGRIRARSVGVQVIVRSGEPAPTLLEVADDVDADLVVVGTRGRGDPAEPLLGNVARAVVHRVGRPTLVVPAAAGRVHLHPSDDHPERASSGAGS